MQPLLEIDNLSVAFETARGQVRAVNSYGEGANDELLTKAVENRRQPRSDPVLRPS
mgnify:CR=1 FL=1